MGSDGDKDKKVFLQIRVSKGLKKDFERVCRERDLTASQVLRAHMRDFVGRHPEETGAEDAPQGRAKAPGKSKGDRK